MKIRTIFSVNKSAAAILFMLSCGSLSAAGLEIGWAECDVTPSLDGKKVALCGLYCPRIATNIHSRLKFTCCAMRMGDEQVLMGSLDTVSGWRPFTERLAARVHELVPEIRPESVFVGCTHNHSAPYMRPCYTPAVKKWEKDHPGCLSPDEYADFVLERAAGAFAEAWRAARPGSVARSFGTARLGHCRIAAYADGMSEVYGDTSRADFIGMLEGEDSGVELLFTYDADGGKTGVFINATCPSQVMEQNYEISSDFAGAAREKLSREYGEGFHTIYHLGPAGCQSPRDLVRGKDLDGFSGWDAASVEALADRVVRCVDEAMPKARPCKPALRHVVRRMHMPIRRVSADEVAAATRELTTFLLGGE